MRGTLTDSESLRVPLTALKPARSDPLHGPAFPQGAPHGTGFPQGALHGPPPNRSRRTQRSRHPALPRTPIRSLPAVRGCLSRHLSRLDKHPRTVSTINLRGAPRNQGAQGRRQATSRSPHGSQRRPPQLQRQRIQLPPHRPRQRHPQRPALLQILSLPPPGIPNRRAALPPEHAPEHRASRPIEPICTTQRRRSNRKHQQPSVVLMISNPGQHPGQHIHHQREPSELRITSSVSKINIQHKLRISPSRRGHPQRMNRLIGIPAGSHDNSDHPVRQRLRRMVPDPPKRPDPTQRQQPDAEPPSPLHSPIHRITYRPQAGRTPIIDKRRSPAVRDQQRLRTRTDESAFDRGQVDASQLADAGFRRTSQIAVAQRFRGRTRAVFGKALSHQDNGNERDQFVGGNTVPGLLGNRGVGGNFRDGAAEPGSTRSEGHFIKVAGRSRTPSTRLALECDAVSRRDVP